MKLPESEIKRQKTKRQREKERKKRRAEEEKAKEAERKRRREDEAKEYEEEEKPKKDKKKREKKEKEKKKEEERNKARGSAVSARQSSSFNPSKGRMGGSTSEDEEKGEIHRLEAPETVARSRDLKVRIGQGPILLSTLVGVLPGHQIGEVRGYKQFSMADGRILPSLVTKKLQMAFQCGRVMTGTFSVVDTSKAIAFSWEVDIYAPQS